MTDVMYTGIQELSLEEISYVDGAGFWDFLADVGQFLLEVAYAIQSYFGW